MRVYVSKSFKLAALALTLSSCGSTTTTPITPPQRVSPRPRALPRAQGMF
jgi:hypothetical protein